MSDETPKIPHPKKAAFLAAYATCGVILRACEAARIDRSTHRDWLKSDADYRAAFEEAKEDAVELLVEEARRRAVQGVRRLKFDKHGDPLIDPATNEPYQELQYSDNLLMFLLKAAQPEVYRDRVEHTGANGGPLSFAGQVAVVGQEDVRRAMLNDPDLMQHLEQRLLDKSSDAPAGPSGHA